MSQMTAWSCARCGALLPVGAGASATGQCPACGQPIDPDATWHPGAALASPAAPGSAAATPAAARPPGAPAGAGLSGPSPVTPAIDLLPADLPTRLPVTGLVLLAVFCAVMGLALGMWVGRHRPAQEQQASAPLPPLPAPGPPLRQPMPRPAYYPISPAPAAAPPLPPARVTPPAARLQSPVASRQLARGWYAPPITRYSSAPPLTPQRPGAAAAAAPLKAPGMATVHVENPSASTIEVVFSGQGSQTGIVGPHVGIDFLLAPGRYDVTLHGAHRTQRFYDAPLEAGGLLELVFSDGSR